MWVVAQRLVFFFGFVIGTVGSFYFYFLKFGKCEGSGKILVDLPS